MDFDEMEQEYPVGHAMHDDEVTAYELVGLYVPLAQAVRTPPEQ